MRDLSREQLTLADRWEAFISRDRSLFLRYGMATGFSFTYILVSTFRKHGSMMHLSYVALAGTLLAAIYGGLGPGMLASVLTGLAADYFYIEPIGKLLVTPAEWIYFLIYLFITLLTCLLVTSLRRAYHFASAARRVAEKASREREELLAMISHDLRNPLSSIQMNLKLVERSGSDPERRARLLRSIQSSTSRMEHLISDLLDASRIENGSLGVRPETTNLTELLQREIAEFEPLARQKNVALKAAFGERELIIRCDPGRILQVAANLLSNALKFTPSGGVITLGMRSRREGAEILVSDTGPGIARQDQDRIFERGWQAHETAHLGLGLGLGLYISSAIVRAHGGRIWVTSEPGRGSCFHFLLPRDGGADGIKTEPTKAPGCRMAALAESEGDVLILHEHKKGGS